MKQIELIVNRYYTKSISTIITCPDNLDKNEVQEFLRENSDLKKSINREFEHAELFLDEESCDYSLEKTEHLACGQVSCFDSYMEEHLNK